MGAFDFRSPAFGAPDNPINTASGSYSLVLTSLTGVDQSGGTYATLTANTAPANSTAGVLLKGGESFAEFLISASGLGPGNNSGQMQFEVSPNTTNLNDGLWQTATTLTSLNGQPNYISYGTAPYTQGMSIVLCGGMKGVRVRYFGNSGTSVLNWVIPVTLSFGPPPISLVPPLAIDPSNNGVAIDQRTPGYSNAVFDTSASDLYQYPANAQITSNNNILSPSGGANTGWTDLLNYKSLSFQNTCIATTVTAGAIVFEQSEDGNNALPLQLFDDASPNAGPVTGYTVAANVPRSFSGPIRQRYARIRVATAVTGTGGPYFSAATTARASPYVAVGVLQGALTKAVQGAYGVTTQDLKDAGRSARQVFVDTFAVAATAETLLTLSTSTDGATPTTGTSYNVTSAKRFRIQSLVLSLNTTTGNTTAVYVTVRLRVNATGAAVVGSPIQMVIVLPGIATANGGSAMAVPIPDGYELVGGAGLGITATCPGFVATTAAPKLSIALVGYEY